MIYSILAFIVLIGVIVFVHELGHYLAARSVGVTVEQFSVGMPPTVYNYKPKNSDTVFSIGALPLGGYVQMLGENNPMQGSGENLSDKKSYLDATPGERAAVTLAGPMANFFLAAIVYFFLALVGTVQLSTYVGNVLENSSAEVAGLSKGDKIIEIDGEKVKVFNELNLILSKRIGDTGNINIKYIRDGFESSSQIRIDDWLTGSDQKAPTLELGIQPFLPPLVGKLQEDGPASAYGLREGDLIQEVNGIKIGTWQDLSKNLSLLPDELIELQILRSGESINIVLESSSFIDDEGIKKGRIGIMASNNLSEWPVEYIHEKREGFFKALWVGVEDTYKYTVLIIYSIGKMISGSISADNLGGPIQISVLAGSAAKAGYITFLSMVALLSINLGLLNLLPIPILDGGQLVMIAIEKIKGSPVSEMALEYSMRIGIILVVSLMVFAFANDIARLI
mgnify:CR=1 FL=1